VGEVRDGRALNAFPGAVELSCGELADHVQQALLAWRVPEIPRAKPGKNAPACSTAAIKTRTRRLRASLRLPGRTRRRTKRL
jgi:hypothetical protein